MRANTLVIAGLAWAVLAISASAEKRIAILPPVANQPAKPGEVKETTTAADPAEPAMEVTVKHGGGFLAPPATGAAAGLKVDVQSGAKGTTLTVRAQAAYSGSAELTFKSAAPMRFTTKLTGMQNLDLSSLTLASGALQLQVGSVGTSGTTKYFDSKGKEQDGPAGAAYTVRAKRGDNGQVEVELRRAAGATLGKSLTVSWQNNTDYIFKRGLRG